MKNWILLFVLALGLSFVSLGCKSTSNNSKDGNKDKVESKDENKDKSKDKEKEKKAGKESKKMTPGCQCNRGKPCICSTEVGETCACPK